MPSLLDAPPQLPSTCGWGTLYPVEETANKPRHLLIAPAAAAAKKPAAYSSGGKKRNLETCTEALGCETGGVDCCDVEAENAERTRRSGETDEEMVIAEESAWQSTRGGCRSLPPPLTTLAPGASRVRMVHERRGGRLEVYAVLSPGILDVERGDGRLRLRLQPLPCGAGNDAAESSRRQQEPEDEKEEAKEAVGNEDEDENGFAKFVRGGRCLDPEIVAIVAAARLCKKWDPEQARAAAFWVATS
jgi:hypothetical protein